MASSEPMTVGGGVQMLRNQYLAGFKESSAASYPTIARPDVQVPHTLEGTIDDVFKKFPDLELCLYNDVKMCSCGKPCAFTMTVCNSCGKDLPTELSKSENVFSAFLFGVKSASRGFPYLISLRAETPDFLIFDDMLQLTPCHLNAIPKNFYIPDFRFLLLCPTESLKLLSDIKAALWEATKPFIQDPAFRKSIFRGDVTDEDILKFTSMSFNFPPSQFQLHVQWIVPPLTPFQQYMSETRNHFHKGRAIPLDYVQKILELNEPYAVTKDTPLTDILAHYKTRGVDYDIEWEEWYQKICLGGTLGMQNWNPDDFQYVVQDGKAYNFTVADGQVKLGDLAEDVKPSDVQVKDKTLLQNYGRPYNDAGKPGGTYIQKPVETKWGAGGLEKWPPA